MPKLPKDLASLKHPNSRKAIAVTKEIIKKKNIKNKVKNAQVFKKSLVAEKLAFFMGLVHSTPLVCTAEQLKEFIVEKYFKRFDEELQEIALKNSIGKRSQKSNNGRFRAGREDAIKMTLEKEKNEFSTIGLEVPDVLDYDQMKLLKEWEGDLNSLPKFKLKRYSESALLAMHKPGSS